MREIEFRAYDKRAKKMYQVDRLGIGKYPYLQYAEGDEQPNTGYNKFYPDEVEIMQYTGLKDKNGKKIFEGDILVDSFYKDKKDCFYTKVEYNCWNCGCCSNVFGYDIDIDPIFEEGIKTNKVDGYIVGNIYENPELLKENS